MINKKLKKGFSIIELLMSLAIIGLLTTIILTSFVSFRKNQSLSKDTETIVETLRQARNQTLSSKNSSNYGVHIESSKIVLFTGSTYVVNTASNQEFILNSTDNILSITLAGGGSEVVFNRLTGETSQNGTVVVSSAGISKTKTVTIYKTGVIESQ
ncbi:prepilin-type N-terminal cleavage/methylation domain-containing protein [Patescibacteria group bacterium]|nr:prepilin-type N-terminal cleavage/methylation domain-containing protein [Patescibacteria group bacterium]